MLNARGDSSGCAALIADLHAIERRAQSEVTLVARVAERLASAGEERAALVARSTGVRPREYRQDLIYVAPDRKFSIVALIWGAGARTSIHDHAGWCAVGVYEGVEHETRFSVCNDAHGQYLLETGSRSLEPGRTIGMVADGLDIHRVGNYSREVTVSLHVYGIDIERTGTSIKSSFDRLAVRA